MALDPIDRIVEDADGIDQMTKCIALKSIVEEQLVPI